MSNFNKSLLAALSSIALLGGAVTLITPSANAYTSCSTYGSTTYCDGDSGSSTYSTYGGTTYYDTPYGSGSCSSYGSTTTCW